MTSGIIQITTNMRWKVIIRRKYHYQHIT